MSEYRVLLMSVTARLSVLCTAFLIGSLVLLGSVENANAHSESEINVPEIGSYLKDTERCNPDNQWYLNDSKILAIIEKAWKANRRLFSEVTDYDPATGDTAKGAPFFFEKTVERWDDEKNQIISERVKVRSHHWKDVIENNIVEAMAELENSGLHPAPEMVEICLWDAELNFSYQHSLKLAQVGDEHLKKSKEKPQFVSNLKNSQKAWNLTFKGDEQVSGWLTYFVQGSLGSWEYSQDLIKYKADRTKTLQQQLQYVVDVVVMDVILARHEQKFRCDH